MRLGLLLSIALWSRTVEAAESLYRCSADIDDAIGSTSVLGIWGGLQCAVTVPAPKARHGATLAALSGRSTAVVFGGEDPTQLFADVFVIDGANSLWVKVPPQGGSIPSGRSGHSAIAWTDAAGRPKHTVFAGYDGVLNDEIWTFDLTSGLWAYLSINIRPAARWHHTAVYWEKTGTSGGIVRTMTIFGGSTSHFAQPWMPSTHTVVGDHSSKKGDVWHISIDDAIPSWVAGTAIDSSLARSQHAAVAWTQQSDGSGNRMSIFCGRSSGSTFFSDLQEYDLDTDAWAGIGLIGVTTSGSGAPSARGFHSASLYTDSNLRPKVAVYGGFGPEDSFSSMGSIDQMAPLGHGSSATAAAPVSVLDLRSATWSTLAVTGSFPNNRDSYLAGSLFAHVAFAWFDAHANRNRLMISLGVKGTFCERPACSAPWFDARSTHVLDLNTGIFSGDVRESASPAKRNRHMSAVGWSGTTANAQHGCSSTCADVSAGDTLVSVWGGQIADETEANHASHMSGGGYTTKTGWVLNQAVFTLNLKTAKWITPTLYQGQSAPSARYGHTAISWQATDTRMWYMTMFGGEIRGHHDYQGTSMLNDVHTLTLGGTYVTWSGALDLSSSSSNAPSARSFHTAVAWTNSGSSGGAMMAVHGGRHYSETDEDILGGTGYFSSPHGGDTAPDEKVYLLSLEGGSPAWQTPVLNGPVLMWGHSAVSWVNGHGKPQMSTFGGCGLMISSSAFEHCYKPNNNKVHTLDLLSGVWRTNAAVALSTNPVARWRHVAVASQDDTGTPFMYIFGGQDAGLNALDDVRRFNLKTDAWDITKGATAAGTSPVYPGRKGRYDAAAVSWSLESAAGDLATATPARAMMTIIGGTEDNPTLANVSDGWENSTYVFAGTTSTLALSSPGAGFTVHPSDTNVNSIRSIIFASPAAALTTKDLEMRAGTTRGVISGSGNLVTVTFGSNASKAHTLPEIVVIPAHTETLATCDTMAHVGQCVIMCVQSGCFDVSGVGTRLIVRNIHFTSRGFDLAPAIFTTLATTSMTNVQFSGFRLRALKVAERAFVTIVNGTFFNNSFRAGRGGAIRVEGSAVVELDACEFKHNFALGGGAFSVRSASVLRMQNTACVNNMAIFGACSALQEADGTCSQFGHGGCLEASGAGEIKINWGVIANNSASNGNGGAIRSALSNMTIDDSTIKFNTAKEGGGLYMSSSDSATRVQSTAFEGNTATDGPGGAFRALGHSPSFDNVRFIRNTAGENSAGGAGYVDVSTSVAQFVGSYNIFVDNTPAGTDASARPCPTGSFAGGVQSSSSICADCPVYTVAPTVASIECQPCGSGSIAIANRRFCQPCAPGTYGSFALVISSFLPSFACCCIRQLTLICCARLFCTANVEVCSPCQGGKVSGAAAPKCAVCPVGQIPFANSTCVVCDEDTYAPSCTSSECECVACGKFQKCTTGMIELLDGFWTSDSPSDINGESLVVPCLKPKSCSVVNGTNIVCPKNAGGPLCAVCDESYVPDTASEVGACKLCVTPESERWLSKGVLLAVLFAVFFAGALAIATRPKPVFKADLFLSFMRLRVFARRLRKRTLLRMLDQRDNSEMKSEHLALLHENKLDKVAHFLESAALAGGVAVDAIERTTMGGESLVVSTVANVSDNAPHEEARRVLAEGLIELGVIYVTDRARDEVLAHMEEPDLDVSADISLDFSSASLPGLPDLRSASNAVLSFVHEAVPTGQIKLLLGNMQINASINVVFDIPWPQQFSAFLEFLNIFKFDFFKGLTFVAPCLHTTHYMSLFTFGLIPVACVIFTV